VDTFGYIRVCVATFGHIRAYFALSQVTLKVMIFLSSFRFGCSRIDLGAFGNIRISLGTFGILRFSGYT